MKPFNLQEALAGKPVVNYDGKAVTQLKVFTGTGIPYPLYGVVSGDHIGAWPLDGDGQLFMKPEKKQGWINIYTDRHPGTSLFTSKEAAIQSISDNTYWRNRLVTTIKIEWEE